MTVIRFPNSSMQRTKNRRGKRGVPCMVTDRWLQFREQAEPVDFGDGKRRTVVFVDVMTDITGESRKLCELCLCLEDLQSAIGNVKVVDGRAR